MKHVITLDGIVLDVDYRDSGAWRCYELYTFGDTEAEAIANATISEVDQDGGEINTYGVEDAPGAVDRAAVRLISVQFRGQHGN